MKLRRHIIIPDTHAPFEDKRALALVMQVIAETQPEAVDILGDFGDFYSVSDHDRDPRRVQFVMEEADYTYKLLAKIRRLVPNADIMYYQGNHEYRLDRYINKRAPALTGITSWDRLLRLDELDIKWKPYKRSGKLGKIHVTHDVGNSGMNAHRDAGRAFMGSAVIGHTHAMAYEVVGRMDSIPYVTAMFGWLGDLEAIEYIHRAKASRWALGFGQAFEEPNGIVHLQPIPIINYRCVVDGELYE